MVSIQPGSLPQLRGPRKKKDQLDPLNLSLPDGRNFTIQPPQRSRVPRGTRLRPPIQQERGGNRRRGAPGSGTDRIQAALPGGPTPLPPVPGQPGGGGGFQPPGPPGVEPPLPPVPGQPGGGGGVEGEKIPLGDDVMMPPGGPIGIPGGGTTEDDLVGGAGAGQPSPAADGGQGGGVPQPGVNPLTGEEVPFSVVPEDTETFQQLIGPLREQALGRLQNPSVMDDELFQESLEQGRRAVEADLVRRGFAPESSGTIGAELFQRNVMHPLQRERLNRLTQERNAAFQQATGLTGLAEQLASGQRGEMRGERGFIERLREQARNQAIQEAQLAEQFRTGRESQFQNLLAQALGLSRPPIPGVAQAGSLAGSAGRGFGQQAQAESQGLGQLASLALTAFGPFGPFGG